MATSNLTTLHEICVQMAKKQTGMADSLTEDAPILKVCKWKAASHGLWNVAEKLTEVVAPAFVEPDAPLPNMSTKSDLVHTDLRVMGGVMEVPTQRALKFGGPQKYFGDRQNHLLRKAGMDTEVQLFLHNWLKAAEKNKNIHDAGGDQGHAIVAVRFDDINNCGLYDPQQFTEGRLFQIITPYGGSEHLLSHEYKDTYGFSVIFRANFGWQILDAKRTCSAIANITKDKIPTPEMIDCMLADVRAQPGSTYIFCGPQAKIYGINAYRNSHVQIASNEKNLGGNIETWGGIPIITSYNIQAIGRKISG